MFSFWIVLHIYLHTKWCRHHSPMLIAQLQYGVTRKDSAHKFSFQDFTEVCFEIWLRVLFTSLKFIPIRFSSFFFDAWLATKAMLHFLLLMCSYFFCPHTLNLGCFQVIYLHHIYVGVIFPKYVTYNLCSPDTIY